LFFPQTLLSLATISENSFVGLQESCSFGGVGCVVWGWFGVGFVFVCCFGVFLGLGFAGLVFDG
jgi:hypothetical protein